MFSGGAGAGAGAGAGIGARAGARSRAVIRLCGARAGADRNIYGSATLVFTVTL
jgi:hypothetical protein